jgi:hypothetical protein
VSDRIFTYDDVVLLVEVVYAQGYADGRTKTAADAEAADLSWQLQKRLSHEDWVARRLGEMEPDARRREAERGWVYRGGPVDWETGLPLYEPGLAAAA